MWLLDDGGAELYWKIPDVDELSEEKLNGPEVWLGLGAA